MKIFVDVNFMVMYGEIRRVNKRKGVLIFLFFSISFYGYLYGLFDENLGV